MDNLFEEPAVQDFVKQVNTTMEVNLPSSLLKALQDFASFQNSTPPPRHIAKWKNDPKDKKWVTRHIDGIDIHVRNALTCAWYHQENLKQLERLLSDIYIRTNVSHILKDRGFTLGSLVKWDAEYQAFVLAVRRCLDYLARALAGYFKNDFHSFRKLPDLLSKAKPQAVATAIADVHAKYVDRFSYVLSEGNTKSVRDLISHYEHISAGCMNINERGFTMAGGGEKRGLREGGYRWDGGLSTVIETRGNDPSCCVAEIITVFIIEAKKHE